MTWKLRGRLFGLALVGAAFVNANTGTTAAPARAGTTVPIVTDRRSEAQVHIAQAQAQGALDQLFHHVLNDLSATLSDVGVKVALPAPSGDRVIWVAPLGLRDDTFVGVLTGDPASQGAISLGEIVTFERAQVRDWYALGDDGRMYGGYTTRAMLMDMTPETRVEVTALLSEHPIPATW